MSSAPAVVMTVALPAANDTLAPEAKHVSGRAVAEVAKDVRADIAAAILSGALPAIRTRVTVRRYSLGQSIDIEVKAVPAGFVIPNAERVRFDAAHPHDHAALPLFSPEAARVLAHLAGILAVYNCVRSTSNMSFSGGATFDHEIVNAQRAAILAAS